MQVTYGLLLYTFHMVRGFCNSIFENIHANEMSFRSYL